MSAPALDPVLDERLYEWGRFCNDLEDNNLGYPNQSIIVTIIEVGIFTSNFGSRMPFLNPRAMEVSMWLYKLQKRFPLYAEAIMMYYRNPQEPLRAIASRMGISLRTLQTRIHDGKLWLIGRFDISDGKDN